MVVHSFVVVVVLVIVVVVVLANDCENQGLRAKFLFCKQTVKNDKLSRRVFLGEL